MTTLTAKLTLRDGCWYAALVGHPLSLLGSHADPATAAVLAARRCGYPTAAYAGFSIASNSPGEAEVTLSVDTPASAVSDPKSP